MYLQTVKYGILTMMKTAEVVFVSFSNAASLAYSSIFYCGYNMLEDAKCKKADLSVTRNITGVASKLKSILKLSSYLLLCCCWLAYIIISAENRLGYSCAFMRIWSYCILLVSCFILSRINESQLIWPFPFPFLHNIFSSTDTVLMK